MHEQTKLIWTEICQCNWIHCSCTAQTALCEQIASSVNFAKCRK